MGYLEDIALDDLHRVLDDVDGKKPTLRVVVGINYKKGVSVSELAEWYDLSRTTIYNWLARLERLSDQSTPGVLVDADRPGRPPKLSPGERGKLAQAIAAPPRAVGLDEDEWSASALRDYIVNEFCVEFSIRHTRTMLEKLQPTDSELSLGGWDR